jgi:hypothetical protein
MGLTEGNMYFCTINSHSALIIPISNLGTPRQIVALSSPFRAAILLIGSAKSTGASFKPLEGRQPAQKGKVSVFLHNTPRIALVFG